MATKCRHTLPRGSIVSQDGLPRKHFKNSKKNYAENCFYSDLLHLTPASVSFADLLGGHLGNLWPGSCCRWERGSSSCLTRSLPCLLLMDRQFIFLKRKLKWIWNHFITSMLLISNSSQTYFVGCYRFHSASFQYSAFIWWWNKFSCNANLLFLLVLSH